MNQKLHESESRRDVQLFSMSMNQTITDKFSLIASWLPQSDDHHVIVDVGTGPGVLAYSIASEYENFSVYGADLSERMIESAQSSYNRPNLTFLHTDSNSLPVKEVDAVIYSSVMHEIFSYSGESIEAVEEALQVAHESLKIGGRVIIRDFVAPGDCDRKVRLYCPTQCEKKPVNFSTFVDEFNDMGHRPIEFRVHSQDSTTVSFETTLSAATEYLYRYQDTHWRAELGERYFFWTREQIYELMEKAGFKIVHMAKLPNLNKRTSLKNEGFRVFDLESMEELELPADKIIIVAEKTDPTSKIVVHEQPFVASPTKVGKTVGSKVRGSLSPNKINFTADGGGSVPPKKRNRPETDDNDSEDPGKVVEKG